MIKIPKNYKPSENEEYMNSKQLEYFKVKLVEWKQTLVKFTGVLKSEQKQNRTRDVSDDPVDKLILEKNHHILHKIEKALYKLNSKTYGYCELSGRPIGVENLVSDPLEELCTEEKENMKELD